MSQNKSKSTQKKSKDSSKLSTTSERNNFSIADEVYKDVPERLDHFKKQREENGFDDTETWHLDKTLALFLIPRLERFIQVNNGYPGGETEKTFNEKLNFIQSVGAIVVLVGIYLANRARLDVKGSA